jgi:hypothetical protein
MSEFDLFARVEDEVAELEAAIHYPSSFRTNAPREAADVANFCMMIVDVIDDAKDDESARAVAADREFDRKREARMAGED